jgi:hypothetical protein
LIRCVVNRTARDQNAGAMVNASSAADRNPSATSMIDWIESTVPPCCAYRR